MRYERFNSFNGAPCGRSEPPGKAEMVEGRREGVMEGHCEGHSLASDEIQPRVSSSRWLEVRERSKLLQLDFQGYPLFKQVLQLLLQFAVKSCQHCVCLLVSSD